MPWKKVHVVHAPALGKLQHEHHGAMGSAAVVLAAVARCSFCRAAQRLGHIILFLKLVPEVDALEVPRAGSRLQSGGPECAIAH